MPGNGVLGLRIDPQQALGLDVVKGSSLGLNNQDHGPSPKQVLNADPEWGFK